jgi:hypothetical protein
MKVYHRKEKQKNKKAMKNTLFSFYSNNEKKNLQPLFNYF